MAEEKKEEIAVIEITEEYMKERIYEIRGQRVILDSDLSEIYGYTTKAFNQQVKNNIEKFDEDFMFELTDDEVEDLRSNFLTANLNSKSRYNPHVFTEQGLYMLMTVLKGPLAVKQSKALIRTFKRMKDYILENRDLIGQRELLQLSMETANNRIEISKINSDMISLEKQISDVAEGCSDDERVFLCGASSKDAGARITSIVEDYGIAKYNSVIAGLLKNSPLVLPKQECEIIAECTDAEKKQFMQAFIELIDIFTERREDGNQIRNIKFQFPTLGTVCLLSRV